MELGQEDLEALIMNKLLMTGRLTYNPKYEPGLVGSRDLVTFTLANNTKDDTIFLKCLYYGDNLSKLSKTLYKGVEVIVEGMLKQRGKDVYVVAHDVQIKRHTKEHLEKYNTVSDSNTDEDGFMKVTETTYLDEITFDI